jgi:hypothetical protein
MLPDAPVHRAALFWHMPPALVHVEFANSVNRSTRCMREEWQRMTQSKVYQKMAVFGLALLAPGFAMPAYACESPLTECRKAQTSEQQFATTPHGAEQAPLKDVISSRLVNNRMLETGAWTMNDQGQGLMIVKSEIGLAFDNKDTDIGAIRFVKGVHNFDIGAQGYARIQTELKEILQGNRSMLDGVAKDCGIQHPGFSALEWQQNGQRGAFQMTAICPLPADIEALRASNVEAWRTIGRLMMRNGLAGVIEELSFNEPLVRKPMTMAMSYRTGWATAFIDWEVAPDGKGWFETVEGESFRGLGPDPSPTNYVKAGKHRFDIGASGYDMLRRELDPYIVGPASKVGCVDEGMGPEDQPMARLRWQDDGRWVDGRQVDVGCADYGDRVNWVLAYLASKVGEPTVR